MYTKEQQLNQDKAFQGELARRSDDEISLIEISVILLKHIRLLVFTPVIFGILAVVLTFARGKTYTAESAFTLTTSASSASRLSSLAAQFGMPMGSGTRPTENLDFYVALLRSRELLRDVVLAEYTIPVGPQSTDSLSGTLIELSGVEIEPGTDPVSHAIRSLKKKISVSADQTSSLVRIETQAPTPELAEQINRQLLSAVNRYSVDRRMSQAAVERAFIEERLREAEEDLSEAEEALEQFLLRNRSFNTPTLAFEQSRLQHQVDLQRQLYITLAQANESARIEEVRNTPLISIIDPPESSAQSRSRIVLYLLLSLFLGGFIGAGTAIGIESVRRERLVNPDGFAEIDELLRTAVHRVVHLWKR